MENYQTISEDETKTEYPELSVTMHSTITLMFSAVSSAEFADVCMTDYGCLHQLG